MVINSRSTGSLVRSPKIGVVVSLFGDFGVRSLKIGVVCDRCLGMLGGRSLFGDVGVRL
ncbi:MAG: hypothetical protein WCO49_11750 [Nostocales cyanobacterium ELA608]